MIEIRNVTKRYGEHAVVDRVSLTIPRGGVTSIIGANGAGKSTLLSIISRLLPADEGTVTVDGMDVATTPTERLARRLAILRQDNHMPVRLTVRELVAFGRFPHTGGRLTAEDHRLVDEALRYFELTDLADRHLDQLSGGQRQRAWIAMALAQRTPVVLLDEPTTHLDLAHAVEVLELVAQLRRESARTIVMVLHDIGLAARYSDRLVVMRDGAFVTAGAPAEVLTSEMLEEVFGLRARVFPDPVDGLPTVTPITRS